MSGPLTPNHQRWPEFVVRLDSALRRGCDGDAGALVHQHSKQIMAAMGDIDIPASIAFFKSRGGHCDCEILLNVDPG